MKISLLALVLGSSVLAAETNRIDIDAKQTGSVISPMLFGCNLEVTRRGIWRGLGAEMVANRKFAAVSNNLPKRWYPLPDAGGATTDAKVVFVGKGSVRVGGDKPGGLGQQQEALAFQKDMRYSFRWWLKSEAEQSVSMRIADEKGDLTIVQVEKTLKPGDWQLWSGEFVAPETVENARLEIGSKNSGVFWVGAASVQRSNSFHGMRRDVIELLKQIKPGALRFPGGCYAEEYRWQDGLLPVDQRPPLVMADSGILWPDTDDCDTQELGKTVASASTRGKTVLDRDKLGANVKSAITIGTLAAQAAKAVGVTEVVFDRSGARYHGKVKALADAAREVGLKF